MKRVIILYCALTAPCIISCNEELNQEILEFDNYITVTSGVDSHTKAGYSAEILPSSFYMTVQETGKSAIFDDVMLQESKNKYKFPGENPTWGDANISNVSVSAVNISKEQIRNGEIAFEVEDDQTTSDAVINSDLLGASRVNGSIVIKNNNINISFKHLMSKLSVSYNIQNESPTNTVKSINLNGVYLGGKFRYADMSYTGVVGAFSDITMYHDEDNNAAEAIFAPHTPNEPKLYLDVVVNGNSETIPCTIPLDKINAFEGGKNYQMSIVIKGTSIESVEVTEVRDWVPDNNTIKISGEKVLWIGTSIPAGGYPQLVDQAMNCEVINNAVGSSSVTLVNGTNTNWILKKTVEEWENEWIIGANGLSFSLEHVTAGALSLTRNEMKEMYEGNLRTVYITKFPEPKQGDYSGRNWYANWKKDHDAWEKACAEWVTSQIGKIQQLSYESLIIDYIDGTKGNCTTVILDHGFNDRDNMIFVAGAFQDPGNEHVRGYNHLMKVKNKKISLSQYQADIEKHETVYMDASYIHGMTKVINAIWDVDPKIKIIIGNYFTLNSPWVAEYYRLRHEGSGVENGKFEDYQYFCSLICHYNEAIATVWGLDIVNVYEYLTISDAMFWNPAGTDATKFCPDGVHPSNPAARAAIAEIYINELDGVIGSRD